MIRTGVGRAPPPTSSVRPAPRHPLRRGGAHLGAGRRAFLRRPRRADRGDAPHPGRGEALDRRGRFLHALNYCMLLPGPEAQQLAVYVGWLLHKHQGRARRRHALRAAGRARHHGALPRLRRLRAGSGSSRRFFGLKAAVLAIVLEAVVRIGKRALKNRVMVGIAAAAFVAIFFLGVPFPLIVLSAALIGYLGGRAGGLPRRRRRAQARGGKAVADAETALGEELPAHARPPLSWSLKVAAVCLLLWLGPVVLLLLTLGPGERLQRDRGLLLEDGGGDLRRRLRGLGLRRAGSGRDLRLAGPARCWTASAWPRPRRGR